MNEKIHPTQSAPNRLYASRLAAWFSNPKMDISSENPVARLYEVLHQEATAIERPAHLSLQQWDELQKNADTLLRIQLDPNRSIYRNLDEWRTAAIHMVTELTSPHITIAQDADGIPYIAHEVEETASKESKALEDNVRDFLETATNTFEIRTKGNHSLMVNLNSGVGLQIYTMKKALSYILKNSFEMEEETNLDPNNSTSEPDKTVLKW